MSLIGGRRWLWPVLCLLVWVPPASADPVDTDTSDLELAESFQDSAHAVLQQLAGILSKGSAEVTTEALDLLLAEKATASALIAPSPEEFELGSVRIHRDDAGEEAAGLRAQAALGEFATLFDGASESRLGFKITSVDLSRPKRPSTIVRVEAAADLPRSGQCVAEWTIDWQRTEGAQPKILRLRRRQEQRAWVADKWFRDATGAVIDGPIDDRWRGGDYWHGRVDAVAGASWMGHHGIAIGDVNGDGLEDLYLATGSGIPNQLWLHRPDGSAKEQAQASGVAWLDDTKGVLLADIDNDGDQDLLAAIGPAILIHYNDGTGRFPAVSSLRATSPAAFYSLSVADYDGDGDLDIFGARYVHQRYTVSLPQPFHDANNGPSNHLLRNEGQGRFADVTAAVGLTGNTRFSLIGAWGDYDDDGDQDLYVANDFGRNNLYRNDGGQFVDVAASAGVEDQSTGMGVSWGDYDGDGDLDLHVTNMYSAAGNRVAYQPAFQAEADSDQRRQVQALAAGNALLANRGDGSFDNLGAAAGIRMGRWGWGGRFTDLDSDGWLDLIVPNGFLTGPVEDDL